MWARLPPIDPTKELTALPRGPRHPAALDMMGMKELAGVADGE